MSRVAAEDGSRRYQARVSIDDRLGDLWVHLTGVPERSRVSELIFLAQLGLVTKRAVSSHAGTPSDRAQAGTGTEPSRVEGTASPPAGVSGPIQAEQALAGWANVEIDFPS